ncbi:hypothetical protein ACJ72_06135 [Emergomyces africanus]|uniref:Uncharacterized protein n=1 Tax=Emergomyces africanus TaxID=1955775 RepID=A0A1B7NRW4_9EURO|nr:hypothetical protein ACJ72_06135 [Emergomyces africanus]
MLVGTQNTGSIARPYTHQTIRGNGAMFGFPNS